MHVRARVLSRENHRASLRTDCVAGAKMNLMRIRVNAAPAGRYGHALSAVVQLMLIVAVSQLADMAVGALGLPVPSNCCRLGRVHALTGHHSSDGILGDRNYRARADGMETERNDSPSLPAT